MSIEKLVSTGVSLQVDPKNNERAARGVNEIENTPDKHERLVRKYLDQALIVSHQWLNTEARRPESEVSGRGIDGFTTAANRPEAVQSLRAIGEVQAMTEQRISEKFVRRGLYECLTMQRIPGIHFPRHPEDEVRGVLYEVMGPGYRDDSHSRRDGVYRGVKFILPSSLATELWRDAARNPQLLRDMADGYMRESVLSEEGKAPGGDFDRYACPPYELWDSREGGSVMAFRGSLTQLPEQLPQKNLVRFGVSN